ncbi:MAG: hypothetical protein GX644_07835, partial [Limnobacter sp.]|nr:hypothetical protein [Limnobacter sp.]
MAYASPDSRAYRSSNIRQSPAPAAQPSPRIQHFDDDDTISIADIIENLLDHKWPFLLVLLLATLGAGSYALLATPIYTVDSLIQVEDKKGSALGALSTVADALNVGDSPVEGEIEILRSRSNVTQAVEALGLQTEVAVENRLPIVGDWLARRLERDDRGLAIAPAIPLLGSGAWA